MTTKKRLSRRDFFRQSAALSGVMAAASGLPRWMPRLAFAQPYDDPPGDVMVVVFLRGGADALNMIVPHGDDAYYAARPQLAIPRPDASGSDPKTIDLDGFFGIHPSLSPLLPLFQDGIVKAVHATGSPHETRSHFEAMSFMERGTPTEQGISTGWVGRHLASTQREDGSPIRGIGWGTALQVALIGAPSAVAMQSIVDFHLAGDQQLAEQMMAPLMDLYSMSDESIYASAQSTQEAIDVVAAIGYADYIPQNGATYPEDDFALALRQTAAVIRADAGLEVSCIDLGGWDTHANQGVVNGIQPGLMATLANGLAAFQQDMGDDMRKVSLVVMSEFGRRLNENANFGTDHGHGGAMLMMSGSFQDAPPVVARWPGLTPDVLDQGEDLAITIDYRDVLGEMLSRRLKSSAVDDVFPNFNVTPLDLFEA